MQVVAVAVERFVTVCLPFQQCNMSNGLGYILPIVAFSLLYNVVKFFEIETIYIEADEWVLDQNGTNTSVTVTYPWLSPTDLRKDPEYSKYVVFILNFIVMGKTCFLLLESALLRATKFAASYIVSASCNWVNIVVRRCS